MSMALRGSTIVSPLLNDYLEGKMNMTEVQKAYQKQWKSEFSKRLTAGRIFQSLFANTYIAERVIAFIKQSPHTYYLTHGESF